MNEQSFVDLKAILMPLNSGHGGCGDPVHYDPVYDQIRLERLEPDEGLPAGVWERAQRKVDWAHVQKQCTEVLCSRAKDLQVAAWLVEALVHRHRLPGFAQGLTVFVSLAIEFWDHIHPGLDEDGPEMRLRPIGWLINETVRWGHGRLASAPGAIDVSGSAQWESVEYQWMRLLSHLEQKVPDAVPTFREVLGLARARILPASQPEPAPAADLIDAMTASSSSRDEAYNQLGRIADLLAKIEPHSPVPTVLRGLVGWKSACFEDLLQALPKEGPTIYELARLFNRKPS